MEMQFGVDTILKTAPHWKLQKIGFLTNDAARTHDQVLSRIALIEAGFNIVQLFSPEHGIDTKGEDGKEMLDSKDPFTSLPIISLYGERLMPTEKELEGIEVLLFDMPDAGTRFYTYLWSMTYFIEAAAKFDKPIYILDRPNPLGGNFDLAEGPYLDPTVSSFIGRFNIPIKHQCTLGELARYFNHTQRWGAQLEVIPCTNVSRNDTFKDWQSSWVNPSPALQSFEASILYPGLCFFEATNVSVGRGTPYSFEWIGANWFNLNALIMYCQNLLQDVIIVESLPLSLPNQIVPQQTKGIRIKIIDPNTYDAVFNGLLLLKMVKDIHPSQFEWKPYPTKVNPTGNNHLSLLLGIPHAEQIFELPLQIWIQQMTKLLAVKDWRVTMQPYLLF